MPDAVLVLASASPRRAALLRQAGLAFATAAADADESVDPALPPEVAVRVVARRKADAAVAARAAVARAPAPATWVLAADTVGVAPDGTVLGKPVDAEDARRMLRALAGRTHRVLTGVVVLRAPDGRALDATEETLVTFAPLSDAQVDAYVATGEPLGKAAAYAVQGMAGAFVARIEGDYGNVVGLPLATTVRLLGESGFPLPGHLAP